MPKKSESSVIPKNKRKKTCNTLPDFETTLTELEQIVVRLESKELSLAAGLTAFEQGIKLAKQAQLTLTQAEQRVQILLSDSADAPLSAFSATSDSFTAG